MILVLLAATRSAQADLTSAEAARHVGEQQRVCGKVASAKYAEAVHGSPTFLNLDRAYPHQIFTALVWGADRAAFTPAPEELLGQHVCVTGKIELYKGKPEIVVHGPAQISAE